MKCIRKGLLFFTMVSCVGNASYGDGFMQQPDKLTYLLTCKLDSQYPSFVLRWKERPGMLAGVMMNLEEDVLSEIKGSRTDGKRIFTGFSYSSNAPRILKVSTLLITGAQTVDVPVDIFLESQLGPKKIESRCLFQGRP